MTLRGGGIGAGVGEMYRLRRDYVHLGDLDGKQDSYAYQQCINIAHPEPKEQPRRERRRGKAEEE